MSPSSILYVHRAYVDELSYSRCTYADGTTAA